MVIASVGTVICALIFSRLYSAKEKELKIVRANYKNYDLVLKSARESSDLTITDFYAEWCGPCIRMQPHLEKLAKNVDLILIKVDIDECRDIMKRERVTKVPTIEIWSKKKKSRLIGFHSYSTMRAYLKDFPR